MRRFGYAFSPEFESQRCFFCRHARGTKVTVLGMASLVRRPFSELSPLITIVAAILATIGAAFLFLAYAHKILGRIGPRGIDAATRIVGFSSPRWAWG